MLLYKFKPAEPLAHVVDILLERRLYCATYSELNDPFEGQFVSEFRQRLEAQAIMSTIARPPSFFAPTNKVVRTPNTVAGLSINKEAFRVCSLTSQLSDVRMWSLYASGHRGVAFELDLEGLVPAAREVAYDSELKVWSASLLMAPSAEDVLTRKTTHWDYEREFRFVTNEQHVSVAERIRRVILGARAAPLLEALVRRLVGDEIEVVKATLDVDGVRVSV